MRWNWQWVRNLGQQDQPVQSHRDVTEHSYQRSYTCFMLTRKSGVSGAGRDESGKMIKNKRTDEGRASVCRWRQCFMQGIITKHPNLLKRTWGNSSGEDSSQGKGIRLGDLKRNNVFRLFPKREEAGMASADSVGKGKGWIKEIQEATRIGF